jgi:DNA end-binding protein Ku
VNEPLEIPELDDLTKVDVADREVTMAEQLIESLSAAFKPDQYHDTHREQVIDLIERKAAGEEVVAPPAAPSAEKVVDLMAALEASVAAAKDARKRHPTSREGAADDDGAADADDADEADEEPVPAAKPKRSTARKRKSA